MKEVNIDITTVGKYEKIIEREGTRVKPTPSSQEERMHSDEPNTALTNEENRNSSGRGYFKMFLETTREIIVFYTKSRRHGAAEMRFAPTSAVFQPHP